MEVTKNTESEKDIKELKDAKNIKDRQNLENIINVLNKEPPPLVAPLRFAIVQPSLFRGAYPRPINFRFIKRLRLKTILSLTPDPLIDSVQEFCHQEGIETIHHYCSAPHKSKKYGTNVTKEFVKKAIEIIIDRKYSPIYIHCLNGSEVTGVVIACLRKLSFWSTAATFNEFSVFSDISTADHLFVENYSAEIQVPKDPVPWIWRGLSKKGVVNHHPTLKIKEVGENETKNYSTEEKD